MRPGPPVLADMFILVKSDCRNGDGGGGEERRERTRGGRGEEEGRVGRVVNLVTPIKHTVVLN